MGPKIAAAIRFIEEGGRAVAITSPALLAATVASTDGHPAGTVVTRGARRLDQLLSPAHVVRRRPRARRAATSTPWSCWRSPARCASPKASSSPAAVMATPANLDDLREQGFTADELASRHPE